jgi:hypothetical protein
MKKMWTFSPNPALRKLQLRFSWEESEFAGRAGEALARETLSALNICYEDVDQSRSTIHPQLKAAALAGDSALRRGDSKLVDASQMGGNVSRPNG